MPAEHRIGTLLVWGLTAALVAALAAWFLNNFERRPQEVESGLSAEALRNPFLAAERLLHRMDTQAESVSGRDLLRDLPPTQDVLVVNGLDVLNDQRRENLHQWLSAGGHLLVEATTLWEEGEEEAPQDFLSRYGVRLRELDTTGPFDRVTAQVDFDDFPEPLEVDFRARYLLEDAQEGADGTVTAADYYRMLQYEIGKGRITVAGDLGLFTNSHIGKLDHALFLALLTDPGEEGKVWLVYDSDVPWLGTLLWRHAAYALISAACLIAALLWYLGGRLGPLRPSTEPGRRDILAHLRAVARFHWRHGRGSRLTQVTRERIEQTWIKRHPRLRTLGRDERATWLGEHTGLPVDQVRAALYPVSSADGDLVTQSALLQQLWAALSHRREPR